MANTRYKNGKLAVMSDAEIAGDNRPQSQSQSQSQPQPRPRPASQQQSMGRFVRAAGSNIIGQLLGLAFSLALGWAAVVYGPHLFTTLATEGAPPSIAPGQAMIPPLTKIVENKKTLTDAQWDAYAEGLKGSYLDSWQGTVLSVDNELFTDQFYRLNLDLPASSFAIELELSKESALAINKGQKLTVSGTLRSIDCILSYCVVKLDKAIYR
jgi:hypothetical protein